MKSPGAKITKDECGCFLTANGVYICNEHRLPEIGRLGIFEVIVEDLAVCYQCFSDRMQPAYRERIENNLKRAVMANRQEARR